MKTYADEIIIKLMGLLKKASLEIIPESHLDHGIPKNLIDFILNKFKDKSEFFIETFDVPTTVPCGIYGPIMGDQPIKEEEVFYAKRGGRAYNSRLIDKPLRQVNKVTVIAGPEGDKPCVLYTAFGGPLAPQEPGDPGARNLAASKSFWEQHALAAEGISPQKETVDPDDAQLEPPEEIKTANRKTLSKWAEDFEETKVPPMSRKDKWDTFERLVKRIESLNISKNQADKLIKIIENSLWGSTSNLK